MARKRIGMKKIRDVIRLKSTTDLSERQIARALSISRPVVAKYWEGFLASGLAYELIAEMADSELERLLGGQDAHQAQSRGQDVRRLRG